MKLRVYEHVLAMNAGFDEVRRALAFLGRERGCRAPELARFSAQSEETTAATMSYVAGVIDVEMGLRRSSS